MTGQGRCPRRGSGSSIWTTRSLISGYVRRLPTNVSLARQHHLGFNKVTQFVHSGHTAATRPRDQLCHPRCHGDGRQTRHCPRTVALRQQVSGERPAAKRGCGVVPGAGLFAIALNHIRSGGPCESRSRHLGIIRREKPRRYCCDSPMIFGSLPSGDGAGRHRDWDARDLPRLGQPPHTLVLSEGSHRSERWLTQPARRPSVRLPVPPNRLNSESGRQVGVIVESNPFRPSRSDSPETTPNQVRIWTDLASRRSDSSRRGDGAER